MRNHTQKRFAATIAFAMSIAANLAAFGQVDFTWQGDGGNNNWQNAQNWDQDPGNGDFPNDTDHNVTLNNNADRFDVDLSGSTRTVGELRMGSFSSQQYVVFNGLLRLRDVDMSSGPGTGQIFDVDIEQYDDGTWDLSIARIVVNGQLLGSANILLTGQSNTPVAEFNNANTYSGRITLEEKLRLGHPLALQNASVVITAFNRLDVTTHSIDASIGAISGTGNLNIGSTTMTVGSRNITTDFGGILLGTGTFDKIGTGTMTLSGPISNLTQLRNVGTGDLVLTDSGTFKQLVAVNGEVRVDGATIDLTRDSGNTLLIQNSASTQIRGGSTVQLTGASGTNRVVVINDGVLTVTGAGTSLTAPRLDIGPSGAGSASANVQSQADVNVSTLRVGDLGADDNASGALGILSSGSVTADQVQFHRRGAITAIGGPLTVDQLTVVESNPSNTITISDTAAGAALTVGVNGGNSDFDGLINEGPVAGSIQKDGAGTLTLTGANTFSGGVVVNGGTLLANNTTGSATGTGGVIVGAGATLGGIGTATGTTIVESGGIVAPGVTVGTLQVDDVVFESGSTLDVELVLTTATERLVVNQTATLGGTLRLTNLGSPPIPGITYTILTANNLVGAFDEVVSTDGVTWSVEYDAVTGEVRVVACADGDDDGICDDDDICPGFDDNIDSDTDGVPDGCDTCPGFNDALDSDSDGVPNDCDVCPGFDDTLDSDGDGVADGCDTCPADNPDDSDGDGVCDSTDICPGFNDNADADGDGVADGCDACPNDNPDDSDGDGVCDSTDTCPGFDDNVDSDSDGVADGCDSCPSGDDNVDSDGDGVADFCDACPTDNPDDSDGDSVCDSVDICPGENDLADSDGDGVPDFCDPCPMDVGDDTDGDGVCDSDDICAGGDDTVDGDHDGVPDFCDPCPTDSPDDTDGDGVCDSSDICPGGDDNVDTDNDGVADFCDMCPLDNPDDTDGDGVCDSIDACPGGDDNIDTDSDGVPDGCDQCPTDNPDDSDGDGVCDSSDVCQGFDDSLDADGDGVPDGCDQCAEFDDTIDADADGIPDGCDTCPDFDDSVDADTDGVPDGCDVCPDDNPDDSDLDGVCDSADLCPGFDDSIDVNGNGTPDGCETMPVQNLTQGTSHFSIQEAINAAIDGDVIEADPGTYAESIRYFGKDIVVRSASGNPNDTVIDGNGALHVVQFANGETSSAKLKGFTITGGNANGEDSDGRGGGIFIQSSSPTIERCIIRGNSAIGGGGIANELSISPAINNCLIVDNVSSNSGGGILAVEYSFVEITNCTIARNVAGARGGAIAAVMTSTVGMTNCIAWGNSDSTGAGSGSQLFRSGGFIPSTLAVTYSNILGGRSGEGNIDADPMFFDPNGSDDIPGNSDDDFRLAGGSPCIDSAHHDEYLMAAGGPIDLFGAQRAIDIDCIIDSGFGNISYLDMGAFEHQLDDADADGDGLINSCDACPNRMTGDVNNDGIVSMIDVSPFLQVMLEPEAASIDDRCAADTNLDGTVNGLDIQAFVDMILEE